MSNTIPSDETRCVSHPDTVVDGFAGFSVPVYRASTIVYPPVKELAQNVLSQFGVICEVYDPTDLADMKKRLRSGVTQRVWVESPGSTSQHHE